MTRAVPQSQSCCHAAALCHRVSHVAMSHLGATHKGMPQSHMKLKRSRLRYRSRNIYVVSCMITCTGGSHCFCSSAGRAPERVRSCVLRVVLSCAGRVSCGACVSHAATPHHSTAQWALAVATAAAADCIVHHACTAWGHHTARAGGSRPCSVRDTRRSHT